MSDAPTPLIGALPPVVRIRSPRNLPSLGAPPAQAPAATGNASATAAATTTATAPESNPSGSVSAPATATAGGVRFALPPDPTPAASASVRLQPTPPRVPYGAATTFQQPNAYYHPAVSSYAASSASAADIANVAMFARGLTNSVPATLLVQPPPQQQRPPVPTPPLITNLPYPNRSPSTHAQSVSGSGSGGAGSGPFHMNSTAPIVNSTPSAFATSGSAGLWNTSGALIAAPPQPVNTMNSLYGSVPGAGIPNTANSLNPSAYNKSGANKQSSGVAGGAKHHSTSGNNNSGLSYLSSTSAVPQFRNTSEIDTGPDAGPIGHSHPSSHAGNSGAGAGLSGHYYSSGTESGVSLLASAPVVRVSNIRSATVTPLSVAAAAQAAQSQAQARALAQAQAASGVSNANGAAPAASSVGSRGAVSAFTTAAPPARTSAAGSSHHHSRDPNRAQRKYRVSNSSDVHASASSVTSPAFGESVDTVGTSQHSTGVGFLKFADFWAKHRRMYLFGAAMLLILTGVYLGLLFARVLPVIKFTERLVGAQCKLTKLNYDGVDSEGSMRGTCWVSHMLDGQPHGQSIWFKYATTDSNAANQYMENAPIACFYDPTDPDVIRFSNKLETEPLAILVCFPIAIAIVFGIMIGFGCTSMEWYDRKIRKPYHDFCAHDGCCA